jgi:hypothetical protein
MLMSKATSRRGPRSGARERETKKLKEEQTIPFWGKCFPGPETRKSKAPSAPKTKSRREIERGKSAVSLVSERTWEIPRANASAK